MAGAFRLAAAAAVYAVISIIVHTLGAFEEISFYMESTYFPVWSKLMMPSAGPPPSSFFLFSLIFGLISGVLAAYVYSVVRKALSGSAIKRGLEFGVLVFMIAGVPAAFALYLLINLPPMLIVYWTAENLIVYLVSGAAFGKIISG